MRHATLRLARVVTMPVLNRSCSALRFGYAPKYNEWFIVNQTPPAVQACRQKFLNQICVALAVNKTKNTDSLATYITLMLLDSPRQYFIIYSFFSFEIKNLV
jgi:hypothetical protein